MSSAAAEALWIVEPGRAQIRAQAHLGEGDVEVRARFSAVSRGTETLVFRGEVPPSQWAAMRAPFQEGEFGAAVKYGYASVGVVEEIGTSVDPSWRGRQVFSFQPHASHYVAQPHALKALPADVDLRAAVFLANMETAVNLLQDGNPRIGERVVVIVHVLRNSLIPVVTVIALGVPAIFGGAIITEQVFKVNGIGQLLITAIQANDLPMVQTLTFIFAVLIVLFNLIADILYGILDPRIRYD